MGEKEKMKNLIILIISTMCFGCAMIATAPNGDQIRLSGFGSGSAEFPNGTKIEKGLINLPQIKLEN